MAGYSVGDTFFYKSEEWQREHLYVIITAPNAEGFMIFPCVVTAETYHQEVTCMISPGEHPFITQPSTIDYRHTKKLTEGDLDTMVAKRLARPHKTPMNPELIDRIIEGGRVSKHLDKDKKALLPPPRSEASTPEAT